MSEEKYNVCVACDYQSNSDWEFMKESKPLICIRCFKNNPKKSIEQIVEEVLGDE